MRLGDKAAQAVIAADQQREKDRQEAPGKVADLGAELDRLADEAARFEAIHDELTTAWQAITTDPWLAEVLALLESYQQRARLKLAEIEAAYAQTSTALDYYASLLDDPIEAN